MLNEVNMSDTDEQKSTRQSKVMHYGMMVCCAVMVLPVAAFFLAGGSIAGLGSNFGLFAPIALCIGVHFLMFKMMGKSCHGTKDKQVQDNAVTPEFSNLRVPAHDVGR